MTKGSSSGRTGGSLPRFGLHVSTAGGLDRIFPRGEALACGTVQIFSHSSRSWEFALPDPPVLAAYTTARSRASFSDVFIHASYLINMASDDPEIARKSVETLEKELATARLLGAEGLVLHPGSARGGERSAAVLRAASRIREVLDRLPGGGTPLLLENTAGAGSMLGATPEEMSEILSAIDRPEQTGICLDSCHLFASGFDLDEEGAGQELVSRFCEALPGGRPSLWHLNDALYPRGSGRDRHAGLGEGHIGLPALGQIVRLAVASETPIVLETPKGDGDEEDRRNMRRLFSLAGLPVPAEIASE
ncbi:MAG: deoxyribonuclease IV [Nitrospiraceae bacterium]|nr:deoxyribonuclease IV [Nitrospiraceae bacterium]